MARAPIRPAPRSPTSGDGQSRGPRLMQYPVTLPSPQARAAQMARSVAERVKIAAEHRAAGRHREAKNLMQAAKNEASRARKITGMSRAQFKAMVTPHLRSATEPGAMRNSGSVPDRIREMVDHAARKTESAKALKAAGKHREARDASTTAKIAMKRAVQIGASKAAVAKAVADGPARHGAIQQGKHGGRFFISATGRKIYLGKNK